MFSEPFKDNGVDLSWGQCRNLKLLFGFIGQKGAAFFVGTLRVSIFCERGFDSGSPLEGPIRSISIGRIMILIGQIGSQTLSQTLASPKFPPQPANKVS